MFFKTFFQKFFDITFGKVACYAQGLVDQTRLSRSFRGWSSLPLTLSLYHIPWSLSRGFSEVSEKIFVLSEIPNPLGRLSRVPVFQGSRPDFWRWSSFPFRHNYYTINLLQVNILIVKNLLNRRAGPKARITEEPRPWTLWDVPVYISWPQSEYLRAGSGWSSTTGMPSAESDFP